MKIKSLKELIDKQKQLRSKIELRTSGKSSDDKIDILVGMATCGIASGAKETFDRLMEMITERNLNNINVVSVGCVGYCSMEPTLQVCVPGEKPVLYGKITVDKAEEFLNQIIKNKKYSESAIVHTAFERVVN